MDPVILGTLIGAGIGTLAGWALIYIYYMIGRRVAKSKDRKVDERVVSDRHLQPMFGNPISGWSRAWAWKPVHTIDHGYIWMRPYWRRRINKKPFLHGGDDFWWQNIRKLTYVFRPQQPAPVKRGLVDPDLWP
jgi:hypothetical protein